MTPPAATLPIDAAHARTLLLAIPVLLLLTGARCGALANA
jgi:hypothetical protein